MNTAELVEEIRNGLMEWQIKPISDEFIISFMNRGYRRLYNHYARASDNQFGDVYELSINSGQQEYTLPERLWSKRIDYIRWPTPGNSPAGWVKLPKIDFKDSHKYDLPKAYSTIPHAWAQLNNTLYFYPIPTGSCAAEMLIIPKLIPLKKTEGIVLSFTSPTITTIEDVSSEFSAGATSSVGENYLTICDGTTGVLKHILRYTAATGNSITINSPLTRTQVQGIAFSATTDDLTNISQDDVIVKGYGTGFPLTGDPFDEFLINYAVIAIKSALNENDVSLKEQLKDLVNEYKSDRVGRPGIDTIERPSRGPQIVGRYRSPR